MVAMALVVALVLTLNAAKGDDAACVAEDAVAPIPTSKTDASLAMNATDTFVTALNAERAQRNLPPVTYDPSLEPIGAQNNAAQASRGQGHWVTGGHGQCSYVGPLDALSALLGFRYSWLCGPGYISSPSHAAILFHPGLLRVGVAHESNRNTVVCSFTQVEPFDPARTIFGSVASFGQPQGTVQSKPVTPTPQSPAAACQSSKCLAGPGTQTSQCIPACCPGRRGFHPRRLFGRLRVSVTFGVQVSF